MNAGPRDTAPRTTRSDRLAPLRPAPETADPPPAVSRAYELIRSAIRGGQLRDGEGLTLSSLQVLTGLDSRSVRSAVELLVAHNVLHREMVTGLTVGPRMVQIPVNDHVLGDPAMPGDVIVTGLTVVQLEHRIVQSTPVIRERLQTGAATVLLVEQLGVFDGQTIYVRAGYYTEVDNTALSRAIATVDRVTGRPMSETFLELFDTGMATCRTSIEAVRCEASTAGHLGVQPGSPVLLRETLVTDVNGRARALSYTHYRSDRVSISDMSL